MTPRQAGEKGKLPTMQRETIDNSVNNLPLSMNNLYE